MTGAFVAASLVALAQYFRSRDPRLFLVIAMFLLQAISLNLEWWDAWKTITQGAVCVAGLVLVLLLGPRRPKAPSL